MVYLGCLVEKGGMYAVEGYENVWGLVYFGGPVGVVGR